MRSRPPIFLSAAVRPQVARPGIENAGAILCSLLGKGLFKRERDKETDRKRQTERDRQIQRDRKCCHVPDMHYIFYLSVAGRLTFTASGMIHEEKQQSNSN